MSDTPRSGTILERAWKILRTYGDATDAMVCVLDQDFMPTPETLSKMTDDTNICLYCTKYHTKQEGMPDILASPCNLLHVNAMKEAHRFRGSYIYMCDLGFMFWTSPIFSNGRFAGALLGSGCLGIEHGETIKAMRAIGEGTVSENEIEQRLSTYPRCETERIRALAELLLMCAESLSVGNNGYHEILKRRAEQQTRLAEQISQLKVKHPEGSTPPGYPLDKERMLLDAIRRGDSEMGRNILNELLGILVFSNPGQFKYIQYRAIELVVLLSRTAVSAGHTGDGDMVMEIISNNLRRIQETRTIEELTDALYVIVDAIVGQICSFQGIRHAGALRKAEQFIWENYTHKISLQEIADQAGLSAPYFSTIFKEEMGENLSCYLNRLRVDRAGRLLLETEMSLSEIAGSCGFEDQSWFSKIFKNYTGISPGKFRSRGGGMFTEISEHNFSETYRATVEGRVTETVAGGL